MLIILTQNAMKDHMAGTYSWAKDLVSAVFYLFSINLVGVCETSLHAIHSTGDAIAAAAPLTFNLAIVHPALSSS